MAIIERVTSKVDLIERKLRRPGMYPSPQTPVASTSGFVTRPSSRFQPITPAALSPFQKTDAVSQPIEPQSNESSPGSSLPCGQDTPMALQPREQSPLSTQINPSTQPFIPAAAAHQTVPGSPGQGTSKSVNGEGVKNCRQQGKSSAPNECLCYCCKQPGYLKKDCPEVPYCSKCRTKGHIPARCPTKQRYSRQPNERCKF